MFKLLVCFFVVLLSFRISCAISYAYENKLKVEITPLNNKINGSGEIYLTAQFEEQEYIKNLRLKPVAEDAQISIYNQETHAWITQYSLWENMPNLSSEITVRVTSFSAPNTNIWFEIKDINTGEVYKTNIFNIYNINDSYFDALNNSLSSYSYLKAQNDAEAIVTNMPVEYTNANSENVTLAGSKAFVPFTALAFGASALFGYKKTVR